MECHCGEVADRLWLHRLSCIKNAGHFPRHQLNSQKVVNPHLFLFYLGAPQFDKGWKKAWCIDFGPLVLTS